MTRTAILGVGHHVPSKVVTNNDLAQMFETSDEWIQKRTGIKERRFITGLKDGKWLPYEPTGGSDLAVPGGQAWPASAPASRSPRSTRSSSPRSRPSYVFPGSGCFLGDKLGLGGVHRRSTSATSAAASSTACRSRTPGSSCRHVQARLRWSAPRSTRPASTSANEGRDVAVLFGDGAACVHPRPDRETMTSRASSTSRSTRTAAAPRSCGSRRPQRLHAAHHARDDREPAASGRP